MNEWNTFTAFDLSYVAAAIFAGLECIKWGANSWDVIYAKCISKIISKFGITVETKRMRKRRENEERLANAEKMIGEIQKDSEKTSKMLLDYEQKMENTLKSITTELSQQLNSLNYKIDQQRLQLDARLGEIDAEGKARDCAVLRDRILSAMRYFEQQKDANGEVHISVADFENMNHLFEEYEAAGGNGTIKHLKETEFLKYKIKSDSKY